MSKFLNSLRFQAKRIEVGPTSQGLSLILYQIFTNVVAIYISCRMEQRVFE